MTYFLARLCLIYPREEYLGSLPLLVKSSNINLGPKPFRALDCWFLNNNFKLFVKEEWGKLCVVAYVLKEKLKYLKMCLKKWNKEYFGNVWKKKIC